MVAGPQEGKGRWLLATGPVLQPYRLIITLIILHPFPQGMSKCFWEDFCRLQIALLNGFSKAQRKIPNGNPSGRRGIAAFSEQGNSSLVPAAGRAALCAQQLAEEVAGGFLFPHDGNSPGPGKALAGRARHREARRAHGQEMTAQLLAAQ